MGLMRRGILYGMLWGFFGMVMYISVMTSGINNDAILLSVKVIALPSQIWSKVAYAFGGAGSFYYNPFVAFSATLIIGAVIGFLVEITYQKVMIALKGLQNRS